jgi:hypothetical protein
LGKPEPTAQNKSPAVAGGAFIGGVVPTLLSSRSAPVEQRRRSSRAAGFAPYAYVLDGVAMRCRGNTGTWAARVEALMGFLRKPMFPVYALSILIYTPQ